MEANRGNVLAHRGGEGVRKFLKNICSTKFIWTQNILGYTNFLYTKFVWSWVEGVGRGVRGYPDGNKASSAPLELGLGLSLAI